MIDSEELQEPSSGIGPKRKKKEGEQGRFHGQGEKKGEKMIRKKEKSIYHDSSGEKKTGKKRMGIGRDLP